MIRRPPSSTRTDTLFPDTTLFRSTGLAAGLDPSAIIAAFGKAFNDTRYVSIVWIVLPVIGLLEAYGLQQHARTLIGHMKGATLGRLLTSYLLLRQAMAAVGLTSVAGHPQTVRPPEIGGASCRERVCQYV